MTELDAESLRKRIAKVNVWYHTIDVGRGVLTPGLYDMRPVLPRYQFPKSLVGRNVLDVGASNGFFSFEFEKLGAASVLGTNLGNYLDHDYPRWYRDELVRTRSTEELAAASWHESTGGFEVARECLGSKATQVMTRIYDLPTNVSRTFDFVFCGSVLVHLRDPAAALEAIRDVVTPGGTVVVATCIDTTRPEASYALFNGKPEEVSWWVFSPEGLMRTCRVAGFKEVTWVDSFVVASKHGFTDTIGVVHVRR